MRTRLILWRRLRTGRAGLIRLAAAGVALAALSVAAIAAPVAVGARVEETAQGARLVFDLSQGVAARAHVLANPDRVVVDLPEVNFQIDPSVGRPRGVRPRGKRAGAGATKVVRGFRFGLFAPGRSRVVIDLGAPAKILRAGSASIDGGEASRLTIELARTDAAQFRAEANAARAAEAAATRARVRPPAVAGVDRRPVIVVDPGHGGLDGGANGADGAVEKSVVFEFARALAAELGAHGRYRVVLTRDRDVFIPLDERVRIARDAKAALFISIHADTLAESGRVAGATIYTVSDRASDAAAARLAEKENSADLSAGAEGADDSGDVNDILFDLTRRETRAYSHIFSKTLANAWKSAAGLNKNPLRSAGFRVLKAPDVPSVLLELGYLSNARDARALASAEWRERTTRAVAGAIDSFLSPRAADRSDRQEATDIDATPTGSLADPPVAAPPQ